MPAALSSGIQELADLVDGILEPGDAQRRVGPVWAMRATRPTPPAHALYTPMLCVIAQGQKALLVGDERIVYGAGRFLLNAVAVPAAGQVIEATPERPCLWAMIELDPAMILSVIADAGLAAAAPTGPQRSASAVPLDAITLDAVFRLVQLLPSPADFEFLAPLLMREIVYRLLTGEEAARLRQIAVRGGPTQRVAKAVEWLRDHFDRPFSIESLAAECGMSPSSLHHQFKAVTAMSPLRFQKQIRLQEANRLMVSEGLDAASAGFQVGYEDPAYFTREYRRFFGDPPRRHIERAKHEVAGVG